MTERLKTVRHGSDDPHARDNFDDWFGVTNLFRFSRIDDRRFRARGSFWMLGDLAVTDYDMGGVHARRGPDECAAAPADHVTFVALSAGRLDYRAGTGRTAIAQAATAGDVLLVDYGRPFDCRTTGHGGRTVCLPRALIEDRIGPLSVHGLLAPTAETRLLAGFLGTLVTQLPDLRVSNVPAVAGITVRLVLSALAPLEPVDPVTPPGGARARARSYLDAQPPGSIDVDRMATALGMSRSGLYRLFAAEGGVVAYDRRRRLRLLHMALRETPRAVALGDLGARFGFFDMSTLSRQFRAQFGHSMTDVRRHLPPPDADPEPGRPPLDRYRLAFERLSRIG